MGLALYDPRGGDYSRGLQALGPAGDFYTASDAGRGFGRSLARQLTEIDRVAGPFSPFVVNEFGAGRGLLARDVLDTLREIEPGLRRCLEAASSAGDACARGADRGRLRRFCDGALRAHPR